MRELIFKNLITPQSRKRDVSIEEVVEKDGLTSSTQKRSTYFIRGVHHLNSRKELKEWVDRKKKNAALDKKFFHILREYSAREKEDKLICKMRGTFYIISNQDVYNIVFVHTIKIKIHKTE
jgi:hypothetical protein